MSPYKGQKLTDNPRDVRLEIRLTKSEHEILMECARKLGTTKTDVIVKGIRMVNEELE